MNIRRFKITGLSDNLPVAGSIFTVIDVLLLNYVIWQFRLKKIVPSVMSIELEIDTLFAGFLCASQKWTDMATNSGTTLCRRWRENSYRRG
jgi:hypothetical protein